MVWYRWPARSAKQQSLRSKFAQAHSPFAPFVELIDLVQLGLKQLDLYLIHDPRAVTPETWPEFEKFKKEGLVKSIGVSNYPLEQLKSLIKEAKVVPAVNQVICALLHLLL